MMKRWPNVRSANGAALFQPGATPQECRSARCRGLKARSNFRAVGSGFQPMGILGRVTEGLYMFTVRAAETRRGLCSGRWARLDEVVDIRLNDARAWNPKSRQGRPKVAHGFNRWLRVEIG